MGRSRWERHKTLHTRSKRGSVGWSPQMSTPSPVMSAGVSGAAWGCASGSGQGLGTAAALPLLCSVSHQTYDSGGTTVAGHGIVGMKCLRGYHRGYSPCRASSASDSPLTPLPSDIPPPLGSSLSSVRTSEKHHAPWPPELRHATCQQHPWRTNNKQRRQCPPKRQLVQIA